MRVLAAIALLFSVGLARKSPATVDDQIQSAIDDLLQAQIDEQIQAAIDAQIQAAIDEQLQAAIDEQVFGDRSLQQESESVEDPMQALLQSPLSPRKSLASVLLAGSPALTAKLSQPRRISTQRRVLMDEGAKIKGAVKWFDVEKGFGFIERDDGEGDVFVHQTSIHAPGFRSLAEGEEVEFIIEEQANGKTAAKDVTGPDGAYVQGAPREPRDDSWGDDDDEVSEDGW